MAKQTINSTDSIEPTGRTKTNDNFTELYDAVSKLNSIVVLTDATTISVDASSLGKIYHVTLGGNRTMGAPTNPVDGRVIIFRLRQDATGSRTVTWDAIYRFTVDIPSPTLTTTANKFDYVGFIYNSTDSKWDILSVNKGYL